MTPFRSKQHRQEYINRLIPVIDEVMKQNEDLRHSAIVEGRIGLDEMNDKDLLEFGRDCWGVEP